MPPKKNNPLWKREFQNDLFVDMEKTFGFSTSISDQKKLVESMFTGSARIKKDNEESAEYRKEGNRLFAKKKYFEAMRMYNKSMCFAEINSEALGFAYANRSTCFLKLEMYRECLTDIEFAKQSKYPTESMHKLDTRQTECNKALSDAKEPVVKFYGQEPMLTAGFVESAKYAGVADFVKIQQNEQFGRHIITKRDLKIGETIMVEKPYSIIPKRFTDVYGRCSHCFKLYMNFIPCDKCVNTLYCNKECMEIDKKSSHKYNCQLPATISRMETFELVYKMMLKVFSTFPDVDYLMETVESLLNGKDIIDHLSTEQLQFATLFQLITNKQNIMDTILTRIIAAASVTCTALMHFPDLKQKFSTKKHQRFLEHLVLHHFHIAHHLYELSIFNNNADTQLKSLEPEIYGHAMYTMSCFFNHSCIPNVVCFAVDDRLICKVLRPIKENEQLFRMYTSAFLSHGCDPIQKIEFTLRYHFECKCRLCSEPWDSSVSFGNFEDMFYYVSTTSVISSSLKEYCSMSIETIKSREEKSIEFLQTNDHFHPNEQTLMVQSYLCIYWKLMFLRFLE